MTKPVVFTNKQNEKLIFDNPSMLKDQAQEDALFQARIKLVVKIALVVLVIAGAATSGLCLAGVIPFGLLHTVLTVMGTGTATLSCMALAPVHSKKWFNCVLADCTKRLPIHLASAIFSNEKQTIHNYWQEDIESYWHVLKRYHDKIKIESAQ